MAEDLDYLVTAKSLYAEVDGPDAFQAAMLERYLDLEGAFFWDLILGRLYPPQDQAALLPSSITPSDGIAFPESMAVHDGVVYVSNFFDGAINAVDLANGETTVLVEAGADGVAGGDIYISDVSPNADLVKIDRAAGEASVLVDAPDWENDSGFGLGGLAWDGNNNLYVSAGGPLIRVPLRRI